MKLKDRIVVVTGAGSGIGRACAIESVSVTSFFSKFTLKIASAL